MRMRTRNFMNGICNTMNISVDVVYIGAVPTDKNASGGHYVVKFESSTYTIHYKKYIYLQVISSG